MTGPWEEKYTVTDSITVRAGNPGAVTVTENGTQKSFDSKASGIGSLTIKGTPAPSTDETSADASTGSGDSSSSTSASGSQKSGSANSTSTTTSGTVSTSKTTTN